jgi:hypothetical protein
MEPAVPTGSTDQEIRMRPRSRLPGASERGSIQPQGFQTRRFRLFKPFRAPSFPPGEGFHEPGGRRDSAVIGSFSSL